MLMNEIRTIRLWNHFSICLFLSILSLLYGAYNEAVFSMVGENGRKALRTKGFKYDQENGLNISKRFSFT